MKGGAFLNDPELVEHSREEAPLRMGDLVKWGAVFDVTDSDEVAQRPFGGQRFPRTCYRRRPDRPRDDGHDPRGPAGRHRCRSLQEYTVIDLLKDGDRVIGAMALDEKETSCSSSRQHVLATGGGTKVYDISTNSSSGTGDGYALGYRAGAELIDMEMIQFHPTGAIFPYDARGRLVTEAVRGEGGRAPQQQRRAVHEALRPRADGTLDPGRGCPGDRNRDPAGRGSPNGGVFLDVTHLPREQIESRLPVMLEQFLKFGVDIRVDAHGGRPDRPPHHGRAPDHAECATTLPGLFACGEVLGRRARRQPARRQCPCRDAGLRPAGRAAGRDEPGTGEEG